MKPCRWWLHPDAVVPPQGTFFHNVVGARHAYSPCQSVLRQGQVPPPITVHAFGTAFASATGIHGPATQERSEFMASQYAVRDDSDESDDDAPGS